MSRSMNTVTLEFGGYQYRIDARYYGFTYNLSGTMIRSVDEDGLVNSYLGEAYISITLRSGKVPPREAYKFLDMLSKDLIEYWHQCGTKPVVSVRFGGGKIMKVTMCDFLKDDRGNNNSFTFNFSGKIMERKRRRTR